MWCLSCFKPSTQHDPSEDRLEAETDVVTEISLYEDVISRQGISEAQQIEWAIQESVNPQESSRHLQGEEDDQIARALQYEEETELDKSVVDEKDQQLSKIFEEILKEKGKKKHFDQEENDKQHALMVQESLYMVEPPLRLEEDKKTSPITEDKQLQQVIWESSKGKGQIKHSKDLVEEDGNLSMADLDMNHPYIICDGCNSAIEYGGSVNALGADWHPECFCCIYCHKPIAMNEFSNTKGRCHRTCYKEHRHPNCYVCEKKIPSTAEGIKYNEHSFWKEKYCPSHEVDGTPKCCSCERLEPWGTKYVMLADSRWLCVKCMECAVMDTVECHHLHLEIREFFDSLNMKIEKEFPLLLVEKEALNKAEEKEKIDNHYGIVTRGICLSEEQNVKSVSKGPRMGPDDKLIGMATESQRVVGCEVTAILILYGLPRLLTGYILAHEMMHAWLRLNGYRNLKLEMEEGICQVLGHMWLESQRYSTSAAASSSSSSRIRPAGSVSKKGAQSDFEKKLVKFCKNQIETDDSPVYGLGFKKVNQMVTNSSLHKILREIQHWTKPYSNI